MTNSKPKPKPKTKQRKPKVAFHSLLLLCDMDRDIRRFDVRGKENLIHVASDTLDGAVFRHEILDLLHRRLVCIVRDGCGYGEDPGGAYTLHLTERAITAFWPDRLAEPSRKPSRRPKP